MGSRWYVNHPTVPHSQIIAVLNGDMIGRNNPDSAALLGAQPPHRNSNALVDAALRANAELTHFKLDTIWDRPTHTGGLVLPQRSPAVRARRHSGDHVQHAAPSGLPHAARRAGSRIDITKLTKMTQWMYATGWVIAAAPQRPDVIPGFKLER